MAANISISSPWWLSTGLRLLWVVTDVSAEVALESVGASSLTLTLVLVLPAAVSQSDMAAERVVRKEDGEKLAKVKVRRLQSCCRRCRRRRLSSHRVFLLSGVRRPVHGDQREDRSQRGAGLPRHRKVSTKTLLNRRTVRGSERLELMIRSIS